MRDDEARGYDKFAEIYDRHWCQPASQKFFSIIEPYLPVAPAKILDLCCGTGRLAERLLHAGHQVWGVDLSKEMIRFAQNNAPLGRFKVADARHFSLDERFDVVTCTFDSLNHILSDEGLLEVFCRVRLHMSNAALFIFDVNTPRKYEQHWEGAFSVGDELSVISAYDVKACLASFVGILRDGQRFELLQRPLDRGVVAFTLERAGLKLIRVEDAQVDKDMVSLRDRYFVSLA